MNYLIPDGAGAVIEWFELLAELDEEHSVPAIEDDRAVSGEQPGFIRKLLLLSEPQADGKVLGAGVYFLTDAEAARNFLHWATEIHNFDGLLFHELDWVGEGVGYACSILRQAAGDMQAVPACVRVESFVVDGSAIADVVAAWDGAGDVLGSTGITARYLAFDEARSLAFVVSTTFRSAISAELNPDDIARLQEGDAVARRIGDIAQKKDDISFRVYNIWEARDEGDPLADAVWPSSPPLPAPRYWQPDLEVR